MNRALSPMVSEFETIEQENSYNEWLRAKVAT
ncbi:stability determinant, partial [Escherichia coli]|nr:stability determinant [Escherichia coli]